MSFNSQLNLIFGIFQDQGAQGKIHVAGWERILQWSDLVESRPGQCS